ncbi:MAG: tRNA dihydrouridine synthase DusB [Oscillospiraceae bacterium]
MSKNTFKIERLASLAPMAGAADSAFRRLCREEGANFCTSEMVSAKALVLGDKKTAKLMAFHESERPFGVQLFGNEPDMMAAAAIIAERDFSPDFIDINMGCPAPKIVSGGAGAALMKTPQLAFDIAREVQLAVQLPVTAKIRSGWESLTAPSLAELLQKAGVCAITVHGRTRDRMYRPPVDLDSIREVKRAVSLTVIGNGDIRSPDDALAMLDYTHCDAVAVGRASLGDPFLFARINASLTGNPIPPYPDSAQKMSALRKQAALMCEAKGEYIAMLEARKHAAWYTKGIRGAAGLRSRACAMCTLADLEGYIEAVLSLPGV